MDRSQLETFIIPARQIQFFQESIFNKAPVRRIAIAMNTNSAFTESYTKNPFWDKQFHLRQIRILKGGQPIVDFDAADNCRLYVITAVFWFVRKAIKHFVRNFWKISYNIRQRKLSTFSDVSDARISGQAERRLCRRQQWNNWKLFGSKVR